MFWPPWFEKIEAGATNEKHHVITRSWVIEGDPLSDGISGHFLAPRVPKGITYLLPTCDSGMGGLANHFFSHFQKK